VKTLNLEMLGVLCVISVNLWIKALDASLQLATHGCGSNKNRSSQGC
jgi:hypothetical protein